MVHHTVSWYSWNPTTGDVVIGWVKEMSEGQGGERAQMAAGTVTVNDPSLSGALGTALKAADKLAVAQSGMPLKRPPASQP
jgi:hypothetical protein